MRIISIVAVILSIAVGGFAIPYLPDDMIIHWNAKGNPDLHVNKYLGVLIFPFMMIGTWMIHTFIIRFSKQQSFNNSIFILVMMIFYLVIQVLLIFINLEYLHFDIVISGVIIGIVAMIMAQPMRNVKMNALFGVRTAWSMKNDESWRNSNRLGSTLMFAWGAFSIVASILLPSEYVMATVLTVGLIILLMVVYGSYYFYRKSIR